MKRMLGYNQQTVESWSQQQLVQNLQQALAAAVFQLHAVNDTGQDAKRAQKEDLLKMVHVEKMVTRVQAKFRQVLVMKKIEKELAK